MSRMSSADEGAEKAVEIAIRQDADGDHATKHTHDDNPNARPQCFSSTVTEILFVLTVTMAMAMSAMLTGGTTVITSYIGQDLGMSGAAITWLSAAPNLACGSFLLFFGRVADLFGRKNFFVGSLFLFAIFSLAAGFAKSGIALDVISAILGLFSASAVPAAIGAMGAVYDRPSRRKNYAFACFSAGNPLGFVFGTICSGIATRLFSWRANYWFLAIVYTLFSFIAIFTVPGEKSERNRGWEVLKTFDYVGTILTVAGIGMFSVALTNGTDAPQGWKTPYILVLLLLGLALLATFLWWETRFPSPLMPMWIWKDRDFSLLMAILALSFSGFSASNFWITLFFQRYWTDSPLMVAVYLLPMAIMGIIVNVVAGMIMHRVSNKLLLGIAQVCYTLAFVLLALNKVNFSYWALCFPSFILCVWGADIAFNVSNMYVMSSLPKDQQSVAGGIFQCAIRLSTTLGLAISTAIFEAVEQTPPKTGYYGGDPSASYGAAVWCAAGLCAVTLFLVPFVRIGTQGHT